MKFVPTIAVSLSLLALGTAPTLAAQHGGAKAHAAEMAKLAPADEYFGRLKMSILGIGNVLNTVKRRMTGGDMTDDTLNSLAQVRDSIHDWEKKYPRDPWLSRTLLALHRTYALFPDGRARSHASETAAWIVAKYPRSKEAAFVRLSGSSAGEQTANSGER